MIPESQQKRDTRVHDDAQAWAEATLAVETLVSAIETFTADADCPDLDPFERFNAGERKRACEGVYERRMAAIRRKAGKATRRDLDRQAWVDLTRTVKERVDVPTVLELAGVHLIRLGREFHSPCPVCRDGVDRLVSWPNPNSRCWCRRCGWRADVVAATQGLIPSCAEFHRAVAWLADYAKVAGGAR